jgi:hypothetical protein
MRQLAYCTNIHAGEAWADVMRNLELHALAVKQACSPAHSFPLGLRLSARAAAELDADAVAAFRDWCARHGCHVMSVNGFPYGPFHGTAVKEAVYRPDWRDPERAAYTRRLADLLAAWTPPGGRSSISTVPVAFRDGFTDVDWAAVRANLVGVLGHLARLHEHGGPLIVLALEPEPCCVLERTPQVVEFFARLRLPAALAPYLGVCLDCCHQAVQFETPGTCLALLRGAGIPLAKVQVSSALRVRGTELDRLLEFDEPTYLHQAVVRTAGGELLRFPDLPQLARWRARGIAVDECRVHFHVPVFLAQLEGCATTRFFLEDLLPRLDPAVPLEVETYSFTALPPALRLGSVAESVTRELRWVQSLIEEADHAPHRRH